jgi:ATP-dependent DNA helicase RecQ
VTPERIVTPAFKEMIGNARIALFAIDEAHCFHGSYDSSLN